MKEKEQVPCRPFTSPSKSLVFLIMDYRLGKKRERERERMQEKGCIDLRYCTRSLTRSSNLSSQWLGLLYNWDKDIGYVQMTNKSK